MDREAMLRGIERLRAATIKNQEVRASLSKAISERLEEPDHPDPINSFRRELDEMRGLLIVTSGPGSPFEEFFPKLEDLNRRVVAYIADPDGAPALSNERRDALALVALDIGQLLTSTAYLMIAEQQRLMAEYDYLVQLRSYARTQRSLGLAAGVAGLVICGLMLFFLAFGSPDLWGNLSGLFSASALVTPAAAQTALTIPDREQTRTLAIALFSLLFTVFFLLTIPVAYFAKDIERRAMAADFLKAAFSFVTGTLLGFFAGS